MIKTKPTHTPKNQKLIGQKCDCYFTGAAMLCKLHAAAPDLLQCLKVLTESCDGIFPSNDPWLVKARAAIAKAESR